MSILVHESRDRKRVHNSELIFSWGRPIVVNNHARLKRESLCTENNMFWTPSSRRSSRNFGLVNFPAGFGILSILVRSNGQEVIWILYADL